MRKRRVPAATPPFHIKPLVADTLDRSPFFAANPASEAVSDLVSVRYPSGATEFRMIHKAPELGDVVKRNDQDWVVHEVTEAKTGTQVWLRPTREATPRVLTWANAYTGGKQPTLPPP